MEPSLWHRLNPFHPRPHSSAKRCSVLDTEERAGSAIDTEPPHSSLEEAERIRNVVTPGPDSRPSPAKHRTPSILRTLAHHPSLSALKSRSKRRRAKTRSPLPPPMDDRPTPIPWGDSSPSPKKLRRKGSLKASQSLPRDLRLSVETMDPRSSAGNDPCPPLPSPRFSGQTPPLPQAQARTHRSRPSASPTTSIRRKPVPSPAPDIAVHRDIEVTPESVRVRRMRFQSDLTMDGQSSPRSRRRAASHSEVVQASSTRIALPPSPSRHLSSPAPPSHLRPATQYASYHHPSTTQHPHPVPLTPSSSVTCYDDYATFISGGGGDDHYTTAPAEFVPWTESRQTADLDDGLDLLVRNDEIPTGTPGGKRSDLRCGALVDGAKHAKDAVRFFSRDMYGQPSRSGSAASSLAPESAQTIVAPETRHDRRSSSPIEVTLSPMVTKRMLLHAFGTPSPPPAEHRSSPTSTMEEWIKEEIESDEPYGATFGSHGENVVFHHTSLSTIHETLSMRNDGSNRPFPTTSTRSIPSPRTPGSQGCNRTEYFTPFSPGLSSNDLLLPTIESPFAPPSHQQHLSAPPLPVTQALMDAHAQHARGLQEQLAGATELISQLEEENGRLRSQLDEQENEMSWDRLVEKDRAVRELQDALKEKDEELKEARALLDRQAEEHEHKTNKLRHAMTENEGYFDALQIAHDDLAQRLGEVEGEHYEMLSQKKQDADTIDGMRVECQALQYRITKQDEEPAEAAHAFAELQRRVLNAETQLVAVDQEHVIVLQSYNDQIAKIQRELRKKTDRVAEVEDLLKVGLERESDLARANDQLKAKDERIVELQRRQTTGQREIEPLEDKLADKDSTLADIRNRLDETRANQADLKAALRQLTAKDSIISVLRDKLRTSSYAVDEVIAKEKMATREALDRVQELEVEKYNWEDEKQKLEKEVIAALVDVNTVTQASEESTKRVEESMDALQGAQKELQYFVDERQWWEEERLELIDMLDQTTGDEDSIAALKSKLDDARMQLSTARREVGALSGELEDVKVTLETRSSLFHLRDDELDYLRLALSEAESTLHSSTDGSQRRAKDAEREVESLTRQIEDLTSQFVSRDEAIREAVLQAEMERACAADVRSRLNTYLTEVDRLSLENAGMKKTVEDVRRDSAGMELKLLNMSRRIDTLEEDKELLNVALESKQTELVLLQRGTPRSVKKDGQLAASTNRVQRVVQHDTTPVPSRRLRTSMSHSSLRPVRRETIVPATPTRKTDAPLSSSTRHNRTPERNVASIVTMPSGPGLVRKSSLPVLKGRNGVEFGRRASRTSMVERLAEE